jgi:hypothetical protein
MWRGVLAAAGVFGVVLTALLAVLMVMAWGGGVDLMPLLVIPAVISGGLLVVAAKTSR